MPLIFELSCEMAYPVGESPATGFLNMLNNIAACFFLLMFSIPNIGMYVICMNDRFSSGKECYILVLKKKEITMFKYSSYHT